MKLWKWLAKRLRMVYLRHVVAQWDFYIAEEVRHHETHQARLLSWKTLRAAPLAELERLEGRVKIDYAHGPTMRNRLARGGR